MSFIEYLLPIACLTILCAGWVVVQLIAQKFKTKNHFDSLKSNCHQCTCGGGADNDCEKS